ncbi:hypothetical protein CBS101457_004829 [Exobasidium rhododendri]|nr:hypothetical protein CBS101457_004829 [Exobasidium rhododendri]
MEAIAEQFCNFYYQTFDADRSTLGALYRPTSMLTFEGAQVQGSEAIVDKLKNLPFQRVQHKVETRDAQPTGADGTSLCVMVTGALIVDDSPQPMRFSQTFTLIPEGGSYYVFNDVFR